MRKLRIRGFREALARVLVVVHLAMAAVLGAMLWPLLAIARLIDKEAADELVNKLDIAILDL